jgi:hypothetical protein
VHCCVPACVDRFTLDDLTTCLRKRACKQTVDRILAHARTKSVWRDHPMHACVRAVHL